MSVNCNETISNVKEKVESQSKRNDNESSEISNIALASRKTTQKRHKNNVQSMKCSATRRSERIKRKRKLAEIYDNHVSNDHDSNELNNNSNNINNNSIDHIWM